LRRNRRAIWLAVVPVTWMALSPWVGAAPSHPVAPLVNRAGLLAPARIESLSRTYLGVPYSLDCLGEGKGPDTDPLFTRSRVDCQTLVEQVIAEAVAPAVGGLDAAVKLIRYRGGRVSLADRYHYCIPDWLENPWPVKDVTASVAGKSARALDRRIDRATFLASRGTGIPSRVPVPVEAVRTAYIPRAQVGQLQARLPDGGILLFVLDRPGIVAGHLGFLVRREGKMYFRHASQTRKQVIDEPLTTYLARAPKKFVGVKVLRLDADGLDRPATPLQ
jgi:hypothetical protein